MLGRFNPEKAILRAQAEVEAKRSRGPLTGAFLIKGMVMAAVLAASIVGLTQRFTLAVATQEYLCLPPYRLWVIDKWDREPIRGDIYAFKSSGLQPVFEDDTTIVKVLEGMPGDTAEVTLEETRINGSVVAQGLQVATDIGHDPSRYLRSGVIAQGRFWFFGRTPDSFDSRYWGSVGQSQIIGKAYPLW